MRLPPPRARGSGTSVPTTGLGLPVLVLTGACYWHGVGGFMFTSLSSHLHHDDVTAAPPPRHPPCASRGGAHRHVLRRRDAARGAACVRAAARDDRLVRRRARARGGGGGGHRSVDRSIAPGRREDAAAVREASGFDDGAWELPWLGRVRAFRFVAKRASPPPGAIVRFRRRGTTTSPRPRPRAPRRRRASRRARRRRTGRRRAALTACRARWWLRRRGRDARSSEHTAANTTAPVFTCTGTRLHDARRRRHARDA